jgi:hypothetical protein
MNPDVISDPVHNARVKAIAKYSKRSLLQRIGNSIKVFSSFDKHNSNTHKYIAFTNPLTGRHRVTRVSRLELAESKNKIKQEKRLKNRKLKLTEQPNIKNKKYKSYSTV